MMEQKKRVTQILQSPVRSRRLRSECPPTQAFTVDESEAFKGGETRLHLYVRHTSMSFPGFWSCLSLFPLLEPWPVII